VLRIRPDNGTIRELNIPKQILEELQKIVSSPKATGDIKKLMIKKLAKYLLAAYVEGFHHLKLYMMQKELQG
jgi:hemerythrin-like domain-containing protein